MTPNAKGYGNLAKIEVRSSHIHQSFPWYPERVEGVLHIITRSELDVLRQAETGDD